MKRNRKRSLLIGLVVIVLIPLVFFSWFSLKVKSEGKTMNPNPTKVLVDSVYCIKDGISNIYLIKNGKKYIAFDAGQNLDVIESELKSLSVDPKDIETVFLTHSDLDHIAMLKLLPHAKVYLSEQEYQMVTNKKTRLLIFSNKLPDREYTTLKDGEIINIGENKVLGILVPGHTPGSMCFVFNDRDLFTGDAFGIRNGKVEAFNEFFTMNTEQSLESLKKIEGLRNVQYFFTGHHGFGEYFRYFKPGE